MTRECVLRSPVVFFAAYSSILAVFLLMLADLNDR